MLKDKAVQEGIETIGDADPYGWVNLPIPCAKLSRPSHLGALFKGVHAGVSVAQKSPRQTQVNGKLFEKDKSICEFVAQGEKTVNSTPNTQL